MRIRIKKLCLSTLVFATALFSTVNIKADCNHTWFMTDFDWESGDSGTTGRIKKEFTCKDCKDISYAYVDFEEYLHPDGEHTHNYAAIVFDPTCIGVGYTVHVCACGDNYKDREVDALGHDYVDGVCTRCSAEDPDYIGMRYFIEGRVLANYVDQLSTGDYWNGVYQVKHTVARPPLSASYIDVYGDGSLCIWMERDDVDRYRLMIHTDSGDKLTLYGDCTNLFRGLTVSVGAISDKFNYGKITCLDYAFADMTDSGEGDRGKDTYAFLDTEYVTSMLGCFSGSTLYHSDIYLTTWNFRSCSGIATIFDSMIGDYTFYGDPTFAGCLIRYQGGGTINGSGKFSGQSYRIVSN